jgi:hypothetical protein
VNYATVITEDSEGNIWIGQTHDYMRDGEEVGGISVIHADGSTEHFTMANSELRSHSISDIVIDNDNKVWISYGFRTDELGGISIYDQENDIWEHYTKSNSALNANTVMDLELDPNGTVWAALRYDSEVNYGGGICKLGSDEWIMYDDEIVPPPPGYTESEEWAVQELQTDSEGNIWFPLSGNVPIDENKTGVYKFDGSEFTRYTVDGIEDFPYWHIAIDSQDNVWTCSLSDYVAKFDGESWTTYSYEDYAPLGRIFQNIHTDSNDRMWLSVYNGGLHYCEDGSFYEYEFDIPGDCPIVDNFMWDVNCSEEGELFIGTGWYPVQGPNQAENALISYYEDESSWDRWGYDTFNTYIVSDIEWDMNGNIMLATGTDNVTACEIYEMWGGIAKQQDGEWIIYNCQNSNYPFLAASCVDEDIYGNLWAGNIMNGLTMYNGTEWLVYNADNTPMYSSGVSDILSVDENSALWISTAAGLFRATITNTGIDTWEEFTPATCNIPSGYILSIYRDDDGFIWAITEEGVTKYDGEEWITYEDTIGEVMAMDMTQDEYGRYWIGTWDSGLIMFDGEQATTFTASNSLLPVNAITDVTTDRKGKIWMSVQSNGLYGAEYNETANDIQIVPASSILAAQNYPNPFNPETTISFNIAEAGKVNVEIFNTKGQKVKTLANEMMASGQHSLVWNGTDHNNDQVSSGVYFYKVNHNGNTETKKMMLIK